ncbi:Protein RecA [endosymbiont DhMRE of Dentiscutata heterogama]|uniref:recombinase RecA n=1 Tax=endosymbiont DhMRE of Dentiscutata heterogama TaxID=1609546 RepID=UPI000629D2C5|nr:recombinase RecA [endosymbiont DhMRE of Dentiscutata heterogama]CFW92932.1 Protein RecA [endosymbiont DhMRE of Dentiscutata heterogama]
MSSKKELKSEQEVSNNVLAEIEDIVESIKKDFGEESVILLGENEKKPREVISTGSYLLDQAIGAGGYPCGRIVEIYGLKSSGKSTLALQAVSECQKLGKKAAYFDLENSLDIKHAKSIGVKIKELITPYPSSGEEVFDMMIKLIHKNIDLIIVDSVSNLVPLVQLEANLGKQRVGSHAALMSAGLRKLKPELVNKKTIVIFINQIRKNIAINPYAPSETKTGGMALDFDADLQIKLKKKEDLKKNDKIIGIETEAKIVKNKMAPHGEVASLVIIFPHGVKKEREIIDLATELSIIHKSGTWYSYQDKRLGQGKENAVDYLLENPELYQEVEKNVLERINNKEYC